MPVTAASDETPARRYDKGERRYKHVGKTAEPEIVFTPGQPRMWVGKCPNTLSAEDHKRLVNEAIPGSDDNRDLPFPKKIYTVHEGAIYEAQTTDRGNSYHRYPYKGKLARGLRDALREIAVTKEEFDSWVKRHIEEHGA